MVNNYVFDHSNLSSNKKIDTPDSIQEIASIEAAQEIIYSFFLEIVKQLPPSTVLQEFRNLFIQDNDLAVSNPVRAIYEIVFNNKQEEFHYTIKRCCYILINNWLSTRKGSSIKKLIEMFHDPIIKRKSLSPMIDRLRSWIQTFIESKDYQEFELYAQTRIQSQKDWSKRYSPILLSTQSYDLSNSIEQRLAAKNQALQLRCRFKFDLAMYMARIDASKNSSLEKPTELGDEVLRLLKIILAKQDTSGYTKQADAFVKQVQGKQYKEFKSCLQTYLIAGGGQTFVDFNKLVLKLNCLYDSQHEQILNDKLLLKTCNKLIEHLTTENRNSPSELLLKIIADSHPLSVVIILLKIVLICKPSRSHLESCIASLIKYYDNLPEKSLWMSNFMEIFNIIFAVYADNMLS